MEEPALVKKHLIFLLTFFICIVTAQAQQPAPNKEITPKPAASEEKMAELQGKIAEQKSLLEDWPNLARYREANATLPLPEKGQMRVVFMGDSITEGWSIPEYGGFFPGKPYVNRGISGQTTPQMLLRFRSDVINLEPKVVLIMAGTNDIAGNTGIIPLEETEGNLASMAELAHANGIRVILCSVTPVSDNMITPEGKRLIQTDFHPPQTILQLDAWLKKYAAEHGHIYLDYFSAMADDKGFLKNELTMDGLHPNAQGYSVMAPLAQKAIDEALKKNP
jgi:lysophospholipase L1-like esterase